MSVRYIDEFRDGTLARTLAERIRTEARPERRYHLMEFCGGHTHAIFRYGVPDLLPENVRLIHGPGCPVCVLPIPRVAHALQLALDHRVVLCTYADLLRVPGPERETLLKAKAGGGDVRMVYSASDALAIARAAPDRQVVFFAIGFETTTPPTAVVLKQAKALGLANFTVHCNHVLTPPALAGLLDSPDAQVPGALPLDGFIGPAHVSAVIGSRPFEPHVERYRRPLVIAGFEPLDVMQAILMLIRQLNEGRCQVENEYTRVVTRDGNVKAQALMAEVFELRERFEWRGLGELPASALRIREKYAGFDAERRFTLADTHATDNKACECPDVLRGLKQPTECKLFATVCRPDNPIGACMVSSEGACAAYYTFGRARERRHVPA
jgi:hydrogenase expression/formation protein HypD